MGRHHIERKLAGGVVAVGWILVKFAMSAAIVGIVFAIKDGDPSGFALALQVLSYGLPMVLIGAACRAVFEIADRPHSADAATDRDPDADSSRQADTP